MNDLVKKGALGTILCSSGIITNDDIRRALDEQGTSGCRFGEALVKLGIVQQEDIDWALSNQLDIPYVRLSEKIIDRSATQLIPAELARKYNLIPIIRTGDEIHIALADPLNMAAVAQVEEITGCTVTVSIPIIRELREMLDLFYGPERDDVTFGFTSNCFSAGILEKINSDRSGAHLLEYLVLFFLQNGIASISLQPGGGTVKVSGRRGNSFREIGRFPVSSYPELVTCIRKITRIHGSRDLASRGEFLFRYREIDITLQASLVRAVEGEMITISIRPDLTFPSGLEEMGLDSDTAASFRSLGAPGAGLVLFVSWNRGERDRFLDLFLREIDTAGRNVVLLGNGIGKGTLAFPRIPLQPEAPEELETALAALRDHAPNLLAIDDVSADHAFLTAWKTAMQGTLVVAGLSRDGLGGAFEQLLQQLRVNRSLPAGIRGIVSFASVKTLCGSCRNNSGGEATGQGQPGSGADFHAPGCPACRYSGFGGKKYLLDVVPFDPALREVLATARERTELFSHLEKKGFRGIPEKLEDMLRGGEISREEYQAALPQ
ncbi:MAG: pilus assembly protein PilB [Deltaproteobacteria bacterium]|nr:pilus assembly protein PilB [Deltaproteobacteria bacterium]TLN03834.1 MAG: pilus assembly protein PilB [bacterium]